MYQPMLFVHWKQVRIALLPFIVASFGLPLLSVQGLGTPAGASEVSLQAYRAAGSLQVWLPMYPLLAAAIGITLALSAWNWDHQLKHVYALSLPLARWEYVLLKMGAGVGLALLPAAALWVGAHLAALSLSLPTGLNTYPNQLAFRFLLAVLVSYSVFFAMAAGTVKTTVYIVSTVIGLLFFSGAIVDGLAALAPSLEPTNIAEWLVEAMVTAPGPLEVFTGTWSLVDV